MSKLKIKYVLGLFLIIALVYVLLNFITVLYSPLNHYLYWALITAIIIVVFFTFVLISEWRLKGLKNKLRKLNTDLNLNPASKTSNIRINAP